MTNWGHAPAGPVPSKVPIDSVRRLGGLNRSLPMGGWAKGMPPKDSTLFLTFPRTVASGDGIVTVAVFAARSSMVGFGAAVTPRRGERSTRAVVSRRAMVTGKLWAGRS